MANVFKQNKEVNEHPNRNNFDLSHKVNGTYKFGTLYPVMMQPVVPGDSFSIDAAYDLKLMPVVFPVQTKIRAHMHFFYVRNKNLWTGWQNWISNLRDNSETPHPYIAPSADKVKTGSLYDHLGVPTTFVGERTITGDAPFVPHSIGRPVYAGCGIIYNLVPNIPYDEVTTQFPSSDYSSFLISYGNFDKIPSSVDVSLNSLVLENSDGEVIENINSISFRAVAFVGTSLQNSTILGIFSRTSINYLSSSGKISGSLSLNNNASLVNHINEALSEGMKLYIGLRPTTAEVITDPSSGTTLQLDIIYPSVSAFRLSYDDYGGSWQYSSSNVQFQQYSETDFDLYSNSLHLNALPFRAYESIYNAYYRNNVVDPLKDANNQQIYNKYLINDGDGEDNFDYKLHQRNYELDFLTSSLPSPQQGVAPLVGMTALGDITIEDENGITTAKATFDDNDNITKVVLTSPAASNEHARMAMNIAASGMSINDFRNTNALQRLLETNIRKGYRYIDFIAGHFGKEPEYRELDMPEFIGGFSRDVNISTVVSQADTLGSDSGAALGQFGGYGQVRSASSHSVRHYCDDYGYIVGILSIVPTPCYSQLLDKSMVAPSNFLDYYFPEFAQTGLQPITYKEVTPIQAYLQHMVDEDTRITDTFGYQRPNYDMIARVDEVHGEFRSSLRQFVINRIFALRPELGHDFLAINPQEINDIFVNTDPSEDTIIGEIALQIFAKRPVPRVVIPNLGR